MNSWICMYIYRFHIYSVRIPSNRMGIHKHATRSLLVTSLPACWDGPAAVCASLIGMYYRLLAFVRWDVAACCSMLQQRVCVCVRRCLCVRVCVCGCMVY